MRSWVKALHGGHCPCTSIGPAFSKWGMVAGLPHFHMLMSILNKEALNTVNFGPLGCRHVREDEAIIINLIRGLYIDRHQQVRDTIQLLVNEDSIANMMTAVTALGHAMVDAGLFPEAPVHRPQVRDYSDE